MHERDAVETAVASGNHRGAIDFLQTWTTAHPDDLKAALLLAHASAALGDLDGAEAALENAQTTESKANSALLRARARLRLRRGDRARAELLFRQALAIASDDLADKGELLALLRARGDGPKNEAKALMEALYDAYDDGSAKSAEELLAVAQAALTRGTSGAFHDANMVLGEAEQAPVPGPEPEFSVRDRVLLLRAQIFHEKYASADAIATYEIILQRDPWHADALSGLALVLEDEFKLADASRLATKALQTNPEHPLALAALARIAVIEGRRREARELATRAATVNPSLVQALAVLAAAAIIDGDRTKSADIEAQALAYAHDGRRYAVALAELLVSMHLYPEADEVLSAALRRTPDDANVNSSFGLNRLRLADEKAGRKALTKAWKRDHFNERTRNVLDLYDTAIDSRYTEIKDPRSDLTLRLPTADHEWVEGGLQESYRRARKGLDRRYGIDPGDLRLEVFADANEFSIRTVGVPSLGA
ncbi:MAG TPA: tetratricopeptide repeat protein, partial [Nannocystis exedens]|nr:tetratricopeptide repeat protein [Nannocystis exedens]